MACGGGAQAKGTAMLKDHLKWLEDTGFDKIQFPVAPVPMRCDAAGAAPAAGWTTDH